MGLLSSFVSGFGLIGGTLIEGNKKAAKKATKAAEAAADKNRALFLDIYNQDVARQAPYNAAGVSALSRVQQNLGVVPMSGGQRPATQLANANVGVAQPGTGGRSFERASDIAAMENQTPGYSYSGGGAPASGNAAPQSAPQAPAGGPDYAGYLSANPDVAQWAQQAVAQGGYASPEEAAAAHYQQYGQGEGRSLPNAPAAAPDQYYQEDYGQRPDAMPVPTYERGPDVAFQDYQRGPDVQFQDFGGGPQVGDYLDPSKFEIDPGYQFRLKEGLDSVNAASAARGKLRSGDAAKALQARGEGLANQGYNDWYQRQLQAYNAARGAFQDTRNFGTDQSRYLQGRQDTNFNTDRAYGTDQSRYLQGRQDTNFLDDRSYGTNLWNTQQTRNDNIFSEDRNFAANRFDTQNANLFNLVNVGQSAAAGTAASGANYAGNVANQNTSVGQTQANAALWKQGQINNLFGSALGAAGRAFGGGF